jgi:predicted RNA binding protein YcfA (HicA-like mRNA interferase family)
MNVLTPNPALEPTAKGVREPSWYPARVKVSEVLRMLQDDGWFLVATRGSHRQFKHPTKPGRVTVAGKPSDDLAPGTLNSILKQGGFKK